jgi:Type II secretory pathway, component PulF
VVTIVRVGEVGGNLPECLERVAENAWEFAQASMQKWSNLAEPIIILVMGLLVGFVVIAVLLPIFDMSSLVN